MLIAIFVFILIINLIGIFALIYNPKSVEDIELSLVLIVLSFIPAVNLLITGILAFGVLLVIEDARKRKFDKEIANEFHECKNCKMLTRFIYIHDSVCPACEEKSTFELCKDTKFKGSENIFFHERVTTLKQINKKPENFKDRVLQQEENYQKILEQKLKKQQVNGQI